MINIISTFYISKYSSTLDEMRTTEIIKSLENNLNSVFVEKIHLFVDDSESFDKLKSFNNLEKIIVIEVGKKPKYNDFFRYIINNIKDKICMITNADIFLLECDLNLIEKIKENKIAYALTRYESDMSHPLIDTYCGSHDSYIFNSSFIDENIINSHTDFYQNYPGIESHIIKTFCDSGFTVHNPCTQIKIVHLHNSQLRNHGKWIGLHNSGDWDYHTKSCWWVPPVKL